MPYIPQDRRAPLEKEAAGNPGELNYKITKILLAFIKEKGLKYSTFNTILREIELVKAGTITSQLARQIDAEVERYVTVKSIGATPVEAARDALGAVEAAKLEFYRRVVAPYEDSKLLKHGEVYELGSPEPVS